MSSEYERYESIAKEMTFGTDVDLLTQLALARQILEAAELTEAPEEEVIPPTKWSIERIGNPETEKNGIYLICFPCDKETLIELIPVYSCLITARLAAGFDTFYVVQTPAGTTELSTLVQVYYRAFHQLPKIKSISAVDASQMGSIQDIPKILASFSYLKKPLSTLANLFNSREDAIAWVRQQQIER